MQHAWKKVPHVRSDGWRRPYVSLNKEGFVLLNRSAWELAGEPDFVELLFDPVNSCIGLQPTSSVNRDAYPVSNWHSRKKWKVNIRRLVEQFRIKLTDAVEFVDVDVDPNGVLTLDLRSARISPAAMGWKNRTKSKTPGSRYENGLADKPRGQGDELIN